MSDINRIASEFLQSYLQENPQTKFSRVYCDEHKPNASYSHEAAEKFVQSVESNRIEITGPASLIILRVCQKHKPVPAFLAGFKRDGKPVWCYDSRLACSVPPDKADAFVKALRSSGVETFTMPAPEPNKGSL